MQRVRSRLPDAADSPALQAYVIHDYLTAARLRRDLELRPGEDLDNTIDAFLKAHGGQPVTRNLRSDWLASLAQRRRWDLFMPWATDVSSPNLICDRLQGRLALNDTQALAPDVLARWILPQKPSPECETVFSWLRSQGAITPALVESRTRAALLADNPRFAREAAADLPAERAAPLLQWAQLLESPKSVLTVLAQSPTVTVDPVALLAGFDRLARVDSTAALSLLPGVLARPDVSKAMRIKLQRSAALGAAYSRDVGAIAAFESLPAEAIDNDVQEWRARAAIWAGDYRKALSWIESMPANLATQPRWRYWRARSVAATAGSKAATPLFAEIAGLRDFYGYLAADQLRQSYALNAKPSPDDASAQAALAAQPGMSRAHALFDCDLDDDAMVEWSVALSGADAALKVQAAHLAARWGWYAQSIMTLAQAGELDDVRLRYPRPYPGEIAAASKLTQVPPDWILAVMRQESLFRDDAVSRAGARGLMQMQTSTAIAVARHWHLPLPARDGSFDPPRDVARGAAHLKDLLDKYGQLGLTLAAYNAGSAPVARWMPPHSMDADVWIENIPYGETRNYVQRIIEHIVAFAYVRDAEPPRVTALLPRLEPASLAAAK